MRLQQLVRLLGARLRRHQAQTSGHAVDVGVHRQRRHPQREHQHAGGRLGPHAGQRAQPGLGLRQRHLLQERQVERAQAPPHLFQDRLDPRRLDAGQAAHLDRLLDLARVRAQQRLPGGEPQAQAGEGAAGVGVGGVLREDGEDELRHRVAVGAPGQLAVLPAQELDDLGGRYRAISPHPSTSGALPASVTPEPEAGMGERPMPPASGDGSRTRPPIASYPYDATASALWQRKPHPYTGVR